MKLGIDIVLACSVKTLSDRPDVRVVDVSGFWRGVETRLDPLISQLGRNCD